MLGDFLKFLLPVFFIPKDYSDVLKRLAGFAFWETYILSFFLRTLRPYGTWAQMVETSEPLGAVIATVPHASALNITGAAFAFVVALVSYVAQLHDRISDVLKIRENFDINEVILALAKRVDVVLAPSQVAALRANRDSVMHAIFYKYASSRDEKPLVDKHDIEHALAAWSWFWVCVEAAFFVLVGWCIALWGKGYVLAPWLLLTFLVAVVLAALIYRRLPGLARTQVEAIARDSSAGVTIRKTFDALPIGAGNSR